MMARMQQWNKRRYANQREKKIGALHRQHNTYISNSELINKNTVFIEELLVPNIIKSPMLPMNSIKNCAFLKACMTDLSVRILKTIYRLHFNIPTVKILLLYNWALHILFTVKKILN